VKPENVAGLGTSLPTLYIIYLNSGPLHQALQNFVVHVQTELAAFMQPKQPAWHACFYTTSCFILLVGFVIHIGTFIVP